MAKSKRNDLVVIARPAFFPGCGNLEGATLLEVLISLFLLACMLLSFDATQLIALREAKSVYYATVAVAQLDNILERLHVFKEQTISSQLSLWNEQNKQVLPEGIGILSGDYPHYVITLSWGGAKPETCEFNNIGMHGCVRVNT